MINKDYISSESALESISIAEKHLEQIEHELGTTLHQLKDEKHSDLVETYKDSIMENMQRISTFIQEMKDHLK